MFDMAQFRSRQPLKFSETALFECSRKLLHRTPIDELVVQLRALVTSKCPTASVDDAFLRRCIEVGLSDDRVDKLADLVAHSDWRYLWSPPTSYSSKCTLSDSERRQLRDCAVATLQRDAVADAQLHQALKQSIAEQWSALGDDRARGHLWRAVRCALTGDTVGVPVPQLIALLGREECIRRMNRFAS